MEIERLKINPYNTQLLLHLLLVHTWFHRYTFNPWFRLFSRFCYSLSGRFAFTTLPTRPSTFLSPSLRFYLLFPVSLDLSLRYSSCSSVLVSPLLASTPNERANDHTAQPTDAPIKLSKTVCMNSQAFLAHVPPLSTDN